jgi:hypothetical protein
MDDISRFALSHLYLYRESYLGTLTFIGSKPLSLIVTRIKSELLLITVIEPRLDKPFYVNNIIFIYISNVDTSNTTIRYSQA